HMVLLLWSASTTSTMLFVRLDLTRIICPVLWITPPLARASLIEVDTRSGLNFSPRNSGARSTTSCWSRREGGVDLGARGPRVGGGGGWCGGGGGGLGGGGFGDGFGFPVGGGGGGGGGEGEGGGGGGGGGGRRGDRGQRLFGPGRRGGQSRCRGRRKSLCATCP